VVGWGTHARPQPSRTQTPPLLYNTSINSTQVIKDGKNMELVVYGSNLSSTVKYKPFTSLIRNMVQIPYNLNSIFTGLLLSDAWWFKNKSNKTLIAFKQSSAPVLLYRRRSPPYPEPFPVRGRDKGSCYGEKIWVCLICIY
jgi:hypothetical protein